MTEEAVPPVPQCSHEWAIDYVKDGVSWAHCKKCPATRSFPATMSPLENKEANLGERVRRKPGRKKKVSVTGEGVPETRVPPKPIHKGEAARYYDKHQEAILRDVETIGVVKTQRKWNIPDGSWTGLRRRWGLAPHLLPKKQPNHVGLDERVKVKTVRDLALFLAGYRLAVRDIAGGNTSDQELNSQMYLAVKPSKP